MVSRRSRWRPKNSRPSVRLFVRASRGCSKTVHYFFLKLCSKLGLVSATKMFQPLFCKKLPFCPLWPKNFQNWPFWPKMPKNGGFSHFFAIRSIEFFALSLVFVVRKMTFSYFLEKFKNGPFWPNLGHF